MGPFAEHYTPVEEKMRPFDTRSFASLYIRNVNTQRLSTTKPAVFRYFEMNSDIIRLVELLYVQFPLDPRLIGFAWQF